MLPLPPRTGAPARDRRRRTYQKSRHRFTKKRLAWAAVIITVVAIAAMFGIRGYQLHQEELQNEQRREAQALVASQWHGSYLESSSSDLRTVSLDIDQATPESFHFSFRINTPRSQQTITGVAQKQSDYVFLATDDTHAILFTRDEEGVRVSSGLPTPLADSPVGQYRLGTAAALPPDAARAATLRDMMVLAALYTDMPVTGADWFQEIDHELSAKQALAAEADRAAALTRYEALAMVLKAFNLGVATDSDTARAVIAAAVRDAYDLPDNAVVKTAYAQGLITLNENQCALPHEKLLLSDALPLCAKAADPARVKPAPQADLLFYAIEIPQEVRARMEGNSMKENRVLTYDQLHYVRTAYVGYDGETHTGELVIHKDLSAEIIAIFRELYQGAFPIEKMRLVDEYRADDEASMADNNSSAFNYRLAIPSSSLSQHAFGRAVDINPLVNPYVFGQRVIPANADAYVDRTVQATGLITRNSLCYAVFHKYGWTWGGDWATMKDYQHFEKP